ncbi:hypothetical protein EJ04DRAFT_545262 [Polyplosphaeria fusca]|uniref:DUF7703 domain-containing protein n=1 Tax=Polyplosphaeria fusca TaxID=682080 RepID=A0A9P4QRU6_9PLEO|nr:hypothetical protein EJ04DRAFT_545262 [Polyplosphaeria fusca]
MVKFDIPDIRKDLAMSMTMAAFSGIAIFVALELNLQLFYLFKRRKGVYFWSCALCSWGILLHPLAIIFADFQVIRNMKVSIALIYLSWWLMTIPFSAVMYSRLHLIMANSKYIRWVLYMIIATTLVISLPSMVIGPMSQQPTASGRRLVPFYSVWVKIENATWCIQETLISVIYIAYTHQHLRLFSNSAQSKSKSSASRSSITRSFSEASVSDYKQIMYHLIATNVLIIALDIVLLGIQYAGMFYLGGSMKPAVYGIKLKIEFSILNRLKTIAKSRQSPLERTVEYAEASNNAGRSSVLAYEGSNIRKQVSEVVIEPKHGPEGTTREAKA